jgi:hypothetical protein
MYVPVPVWILGDPIHSTMHTGGIFNSEEHKLIIDDVETTEGSGLYRRHSTKRSKTLILNDVLIMTCDDPPSNGRHLQTKQIMLEDFQARAFISYHRQ